MGYATGRGKESWYLDKIQKLNREVGWQIMQLFNL